MNGLGVVNSNKNDVRAVYNALFITLQIKSLPRYKSLQRNEIFTVPSVLEEDANNLL